MTSPGSPSQFSGRSLRWKNKPEPPEPAGFLRTPVRLIHSVPSSPSQDMRGLQSLCRGLYTLGSRPTGKTGNAASRCRFCGTLSANKVGSERFLDGVRLVWLVLGREPPGCGLLVGESRSDPYSEGDAGQEKILHGIQHQPAAAAAVDAA